MALIIPEWANQDGRLVVSNADANVQVWPGAGASCLYQTFQINQPTRASTTFTRGSIGPLTSNNTVSISWDGVWYFIPGNTAVTVPNAVYYLATLDSNVTVT